MTLFYFDVLTMDACHVLLGRLSQHDRRVIHDEWKNTYLFEKDGKKLKLHSSNQEMDKEGKVMILSYVQGMEKKMDGGNKDQSIGSMERVFLKEE